MKRLMISLMSLAAILSCSRELRPDSEPAGPAQPATDQVAMSFTAVTEEVKTSLDNSDFSILWSDADHITVFAGDNDASGATFDVSATARGGLEATFSGTSETADVYYALSPAQNTASISDGSITATLETSQTPVAGSFGPTANLSVAMATDHTFQFKNVGSLVGLTIGNDDITGVKLEALGGEPLSGTAVINPDGSVEGVIDGCAYVQMSGSLVKGSTYYFLVYPGTYSSGFRITLAKSGEFATITKGDGKTLVRNGNISLGTLTASNWKYDFELGEAVTIEGAGAAEAGQDVAYVGSNDYWNASLSHVSSELADYPYNYEIFTRLTGGSLIHFEAENGAIFTLNAAGTAVSQVASASSAAFSAPADGIYRIRMALPYGDAEVMEVTAAKVYQNSCSRENSSDGYMTLTYNEKGSWYVNNFCLRRGNDGWANRYKFRFTLKDLSSGDESTANYGRKSSNGSNPSAYPDGAVGGSADYTGEDYFYVQPADGDSFEPGFKFVSTYEIAENRYYARLGLEMNNRLGHYTHTITWILDNRIVAGDEVRITGPGVQESGNQQQMRYSASFNNSNIENYGDESAVAGASGYNYEVFCRLESGKKFFFATPEGKHYELNGDASALIPLYPGWGAISYNGVENGGVYRIRANFETGAVSLDRISEARYLQMDRGTNAQLSYEGNGVWKLDNMDFGWTHPNAWGNNERFKFWFQIYFMDKSTWQYLGRYDDDADGVNIQTVTNASWSWNNKLSAEHKDGLNAYLTDDYTATVRLKLNADGYTYEFSNITAK